MDLKKIISQGESESLEFKESLKLKDKVGESISAFSNSKGGTILIGITDKEEIKGVQIGKKTAIDLAEYIKRNTDPQIFPEIRIYEIGDKKVILVKIKEANEKPVFFESHTYKRVGDTNQRISSSEIRKLAKESGEKIYWDEQICEKATLEDIDWEFVKNFFIPLYEEISKKKITGKVDLILRSLRCIKNKKPTNSGILLFSKNPQKFFINCHIALARYKGEEVGVERLDYKEFDGNLFKQIDECNKYLKEHISIMSRLHPYQIQREDIPEYGLFSIRELITNAVCHRDYENQHTKAIIKIFDDRIEFYNPGGLPEDITPDNITEKQFSRNPVIAKVLAKVRYIEELGEGWDKIIKEHREHPLSPHFPKIISDKTSTLITIFSVKEKFKEDKINQFPLNERQKKALEYISQKNRITNSEYRKLFPGITDRTVLNDLKDMVKEEILIKVGKTRSTFYQFRNNSEIIPK